MIAVICDKCKKKCEGTTYYTVDIYGHDINPTDDDKNSLTTAAQNISTNMAKIDCQEKHYCESCKDKIQNFLTSEDVASSHIKQIPPPPKEPPLRILTETFGFKKKRSEQERLVSKIAFHKWLKENI